MRGIIFRGKRIDNGEWVEGWLFKYMSSLCIGWEHGIECDYDDGGLEEHTYAFVIPESISQFTGSCDKNGKRIFEGDIVLMPEGFIDCVIYEEGCFLMERQIMFYEWTYQSPEEMEVIGNRADNPELLEVDDGT